MRVDVLAVAEDTGLITVDSPAGRFDATWSGPAPAVGDVVDVEVDCEPSRWTDVAVGTTRVLPPGCWLHGVVEHVDDDGVVVLRSGPVALIEIEMLGAPPEGVLGVQVAIPVTKARLFPTNI